ncbi:rhamnogalacturonan lyase B N-terminal domain-containing protein [Celerinatantimonas sp. YJH-8]|uniref:rhamnogalacturonan lyase B N-terminal domain-containing protein n=1 Tax=Celerinatantimonas sp. YJH-8 TaxID=3228714 RepID=UPI0038C11553
MFLHIKLCRAVHRLGVGLAACIALVASPWALADFGLTTSTDYYTVDTGAGLIFKILRQDGGSNTRSPGDIASLVIDGVEYEQPNRGSQINSGFDYLYTSDSSVSLSAQQVNSQTIKITVTAGHLTHYYMARRGERRIYMATYFTEEPTTMGLVRFILRMQYDRLPHGPEPADISQTVSTVEAHDIFALANGETRSKHYSNHRLMDWKYIGGTGNHIGIWVVRDNGEGGSGGPFYRSLLNQVTAHANEITYIVNYNEAQTEALRTHVLNAYTLVVTDGSAPSTNIDTSWFSQMSLLGYVPDSQRGRVAGVGINGMDSDYQYTVGFANSRAQYWTHPSSSGYFSLDRMLPGTYTMTIYKNELAVHTQSITVSAGSITSLHTITITGDPSQQSAIFRVGHWDGTPTEFLNGDKVTTMHPSDVRMANWSTPTWTAGSSSSRDFPAYIWKDVNNGRQISFRLSNSQRQSAHTVRVGITVAYANARPIIKVNDWQSSVPAISQQPSTRTLTIGTYRGNNHTYEFTVPASAWNTQSSWNTLTISAASGSGGSQYLSAGFSVDCIDLLN